MSWNVLKRSFSKTSDKHLNRQKFCNFAKRRKLNKRFADEETKISNDSDSDVLSESFLSKSKFKDSRSKSPVMDFEEEGRIDYDPDMSNGCNGCSSMSQKVTSQPLVIYNEKYRKIAHTSTRYLNTYRNEKLKRNLSYDVEDIAYGKENIFDRGLPSKNKNANIEDTCNKSLVRSESSTCTDKHKSWLTLKKVFADCWEQDTLDLELCSDDLSQCSVSSMELNSSKILNCSPNKQKELMGNHQKTRKSNPELNLLILEMQKQKNYDKKISAKKGGLLEKLRKALRRSESDQAFWVHEGYIGLREKGCIAKVKNKINSFGRIIVTLNINGKEIKVIPTNSKLEKFLLVDSEVEIYMDSNLYHVKSDVYYLKANKVAKK